MSSGAATSSSVGHGGVIGTARIGGESTGRGAKGGKGGRFSAGGGG
jgi:hypothetical protein